MKKQLLSAVLAALMIAGSAAAASAKTYDDVGEDNAALTEISMLSDIGVIKGTSENKFSPDEKVSREQMASLLFRLMLGRDDAGRENTTRFRDLYEPYYNGAISWANASGYIRGTSEETFDPRGGITKQDAMTMLVRALGHETGNMNAGYPWSYINKAIRLGLDRNLEDVRYTDTLTRAETAVLLANALTADMLVSRSGANGALVTEGTTIIEEVFSYEMTEAVLEATNRYALEGDPVVKNGYVSLKTPDGGHMTVNAAGTGIEDPDAHLGETYRMIVKNENGRDSVLSAVSASVRETCGKAEIDKNRVKIGGESYVLVEDYSDALSTNENELKLYAFGNDGTLNLVKNIDELKPLLGFFRIDLLKESADQPAKTAVLMPLSLGKLETDADGKVNLADGAKDFDIVNEANAVNGDYVLYYCNKPAKQLVIADVCDIVAGIVDRITSANVRIGGETYALGNAAAGIGADTVSSKLTLGRDAVAVVEQGAVVDVIRGTAVSSDSAYLTALSDAFRVYENGSFGYVMTVWLDGREQNISVKNGDAKGGEVYRYLETDGVYTLIRAEEKDGNVVSGRRAFIQKDGRLDEMAMLIADAKNTSLVQVGRNTFALRAGDADILTSAGVPAEITFIVEADSVAAVGSDGAWTEKHGSAIGEIRIADGSKIVAVFDNEVGSVETLKYLSVAQGSFGSYDPDGSAVRILALNGKVYENGRTLAEYIAYDFAAGEIVTVLSADAELEIGADYRMGSDGLVSDAKAEMTEKGFVTGYTSGTVSVDGKAYAIGADMKTIRITDDNKSEDVKLTDLYMKHVEFVAANGEIRLMIETGDPSFRAEMTEEGIAITPDFDLTDFRDATLSVTGLKKDGEAVKIDGMTIGIEEGVILAKPTDALEAGEYVITFTVNSKNGSADFTVTAAAEEVPENESEPAPEEGNGEENNG